MCAVSALYAYFGERPNTPWTRETFKEFQDIVKRLDTLDHSLEQPECDDPSKADWMRTIERRLRDLELRGGLTGGLTAGKAGEEERDG